jgi:hypothetical protein
MEYLEKSYLQSVLGLVQSRSQRVKNVEKSVLKTPVPALGDLARPIALEEVKQEEALLPSNG